MNRLRNIFILSILLFVSSWLAGCASSPDLGTPDANNVSLVFGHIDASTSPYTLDSVQMKRTSPKTSTPYYNFWVVDGTFFRADVPRGNYRLNVLSGHADMKNNQIKLDLPDTQKQKLQVSISKPNTYYVGSFTYQPGSNTTSPRLINKTTPSESELLKKILPYAKDPYWRRMIEQRLNELP